MTGRHDSAPHPLVVWPFRPFRGPGEYIRCTSWDRPATHVRYLNIVVVISRDVQFLVGLSSLCCAKVFCTGLQHFRSTSIALVRSHKTCIELLSTISSQHSCRKQARLTHRKPTHNTKTCTQHGSKHHCEGWGTTKWRQSRPTHRQSVLMLQLESATGSNSSRVVGN